MASKISLKIFSFILNAVESFCKSIDSKQSADTRYVPGRISLVRPETNELIYDWDKNSGEKSEKALINFAHRMSYLNENEKIQMKIVYIDHFGKKPNMVFTENIRIPNDVFGINNFDSSFLEQLEQKEVMNRANGTISGYMSYYRYNKEAIDEVKRILLDGKNLLDGKSLRPDFFGSPDMCYRLITLDDVNDDYLKKYVYDKAVIAQISVIISKFKNARAKFIVSFDSQGKKYRLPNYENIVAYLDAYHDLIKNILEITNTNSGRGLLDAKKSSRNLLDILLNIDFQECKIEECKIDGSDEWEITDISFINPVVLHSYFVSMLFLGKQILDDEYIISPNFEKIDASSVFSYSANSDIIMAQIVNNFKYSFYYNRNKYSVGSIYELNDNIESDVEGNHDFIYPVNYCLKLTRHSELQSYNVIAPVRFYKKITSALQYDIKSTEDMEYENVNIAVFGYMPKFSFSVFAHLLEMELRSLDITVKNFNFNFYRFAGKPMEEEYKVSPCKIRDTNFSIKYMNDPFVFEDGQIGKLYDENDIVFFLDVPFFYDEYVPETNKSDFSLRNMKEGKYSEKLDWWSIFKGIGSKTGDLVHLYNHASSTNNGYNDAYEINITKIGRFLTILEDEKRAKQNVVYFYISDEKIKFSTLNMDFSLNYCREEFYDRKHIEVIKATSPNLKSPKSPILINSVNSAKTGERLVLPIAFWQFLKPLSSTLYVNMIKSSKIAEYKGDTGKKTELYAKLVYLMDNMYVVINYAKIYNIKMYFSMDDNKIKKAVENLIGDLNDECRTILGGCNIEDELMKIMIQFINECFAKRDKAEMAAKPFDRVNIMTLSVTQMIHMVIYNSCRGFYDVLFGFLYKNYTENLAIELTEEFLDYDGDFSKDFADVIRYRDKKRDYQIMQNLNSYNALMISSSFIKNSMNLTSAGYMNFKKDLKRNMSEMGADKTQIYNNI